MSISCRFRKLKVPFYYVYATNEALFLDSVIDAFLYLHIQAWRRKKKDAERVSPLTLTMWYEVKWMLSSFTTSVPVFDTSFCTKPYFDKVCKH